MWPKVSVSLKKAFLFIQEKNHTIRAFERHFPLRNVFLQPPQEKVVEDLMEGAAALSCIQMGYKRDYVEKAVRSCVNDGKFTRAQAENKHDLNGVSLAG